MKNAALLLLASLSLVAVNVQAKPEKNKGLPPGLQKKAERGQALPPGWQKKLAVGGTLDKTVYAHGKIVVPIDDKGIITLHVEDKMIRLFKATREIVEILN